MTLVRYGGGALALILLAGAPAYGLAATGISISGQAPLVCSAGIDPASASPQGQTPLGQLNEFCNDPEGFDVWIDYPASLAHASLIVDGKAMPLSPRGSIRVSHAVRPGRTSLSLALSGAPGQAAIPLTVRMIPSNATALALASVP